MKENLDLLLNYIDEEVKEILKYTDLAKDPSLSDETIVGAEANLRIFEKPIIINNEKELTNQWKKFRGHRGIYFFFIIDDFNVTKEEENLFNEINSAGMNKVNPIEDIERTFAIGDCLYLGSCLRKGVGSRLKEHISEDKGSGALRLNNPKRRFMSEKVRVFAFLLKPEYDCPGNRKRESKYRRIILPLIEKNLHEQLRPRCGSSRV